MFVPLLVVTAVATFQVGSHVKPEFEATGSILLLPPTGKPVPPPAGKPAPPANQWAEAGPVQMAQAVLISLEKQASREKAASAGYEPGYKLAIVPRSAIITVTVTSISSAKSKATVQYVVKLISDEVNAKQKAFEAQPTLKISTESLDGEGTVKTVTTGVRRAQIGIAGGGLLATVMITVLVDAIIRLVQRRRERILRTSVRAQAPVQVSKAAAKDNKPADATMVIPVIRDDTEPTMPLQ
ncbi:hypothetical protein [Longispora albida]|uniref:hypothetical protein n=1 Tax=Longispora albida TaxID=203523 RepID=UPI00037844DB|nr:hypothetical protein [Longispora albida]